jgi:3'(2'), 5'-bisphosphate nucleotidase
MTESSLDLPALADALLPVAVAAGEAILRHYAAGVDVVRKSDGSPTTAADAEAEAIITAALAQLAPDIAIVAEEAMEGSAGPAILPDAPFWLVDPLDGTKEFIGRTGQFTVNIALIVAAQAVLGVVYVPAEGVLYWGTTTGGAFRQQLGQTLASGGVGADANSSSHTPHPISHPLPQRLRLAPAVMPPYRVVMSHSHGDRRGILEHFSHLPLGEIVRAGSSLKFCRVAEGAADFYPRLGPTMEWDTAAGQAVLEAAGGVITRLDGAPFRYHKAGWRNPGFAAFHPGVPVFGQMP